MLLIGILCFILLMSFASATQPQRLNITITETVYRNTTFANNFVLTETVASCIIEGDINVTNPSSDTVNDIYVNFSHTENMLTNMTNSAGRAAYQIVGSANGTDNPFVMHIPELLAGESTLIEYNVSCLSVTPPLDVETTYANSDHNFNRKVLAGNNWTINQTVINALVIDVPINNINITMTAQNVTWNGTSDNFSLIYLYELGDYANVYGNETSDAIWNWVVNAGQLANYGDNTSIVFNMTAPDNIPTSMTYLGLIERLTYEVSYLSSNLSLDSITAVSDLEFGTEKRIIQPADNDNNTNVTWRTNSDVYVPFNISYNLTVVTVWVTESLNMSDKNTSFGYLEINYTPGVEINQTNPWAGAPWDFNFTDASHNVSARPPIVWIRPFFHILSEGSQIVNSTLTQNGADYYLKYIYVINGYWLQIDKNITSIDQDTYKIDVYVENIGNAWTPAGLVVTVYDFVPSEFTMWNLSTSWDSNSTLLGTDFNGTSYRWSIPKKGVYNASLGPRTEDHANRTWNVTYYVNGTGSYKVSDLYIVGLDPRQVDGAGSHEGISMVKRLASSTTEIFYFAVVLFLIALNIANFTYTKRIDEKLSKKK